MKLPEEISLTLGLDAADDPGSLRELAARQLGLPAADLPEIILRKRSIDARRGRVRFQLVVSPRTGPEPPLGHPLPRPVAPRPHIVIVGGGPAGLFCAYELSRGGIGSTVLERGKPVQPRRHDLKALHERGEVNPDSNYCFGEGGAGTFSDGKLYTRAHKRGPVRDVIETLALHGAPSAILTEARPHVGSNLLPRVVTALRARLRECGVQFRFDARVTELCVEQAGSGRRAVGVKLADGSEVLGDAVVVATGHSARDVHLWLERAGAELEPKPFALGVRIEHPQPLINRIQYGRHADHPRLPNAPYRLASTAFDRSVFSFCMCPGGFIVPAATGPEELVVNGMSLSRRSSPRANSGLVVALQPRDWEAAGLAGALGGVELQRRIERAAFAAGGGRLVAPAVRATDFVKRRASSTLPQTSYLPGVRSASLDEVLDAAGVALAEPLRRALVDFDRQMPGYLTDDAVLVGVESRTSSPVRVSRDPKTLCARGIDRLYPVGEGAGYAGGIVSAALDGIAVAKLLSAGR